MTLYRKQQKTDVTGCCVKSQFSRYCWSTVRTTTILNENVDVGHSLPVESHCRKISLLQSLRKSYDASIVLIVLYNTGGPKTKHYQMIKKSY